MKFQHADFGAAVERSLPAWGVRVEMCLHIKRYFAC